MYRDIKQWLFIRDRMLKDGVSERQIQRETGISRTTISKMVANPFPLQHASRAKSRPKLGPFILSIQRMLEENDASPAFDQHTSKAIYEQICEEGFTGSYSTVRDFIRMNRQRPSQRDHLQLWQQGDTQIWKQLSGLITSLSSKQAEGFLLLLSQADPPLVSEAKAERIVRAVANEVDVVSEPNPRDIGFKAAQEWMHGVLQGSISAQDIETDESNSPECKRLLELVINGRLSVRNKALTVLAHRHGIPARIIYEFLDINKQSHRRFVCDYERGGLDALLARKTSHTRKVDDEEIKKAVFSTLHEPPSNYGINRTTWKMEDLTRVLREKGHYACKDVVRQIIKDAGYRWRKARTVLTSKDPDYRAKLDHIQHILSSLQANEAFFSIDEFGPFTIKMHGGRALAAPGEQRTVPQWQQTKGCLILTAALELSANQILHFYSDKKNTAEMIHMAELLVDEYQDRQKIYLSWDAASWHISKKLEKWIKDHNTAVSSTGKPIVETAPLPAGAQFLNVIESVFSGMARAILHNSDYQSIDAAKDAIDKYFYNRNAIFKLKPRRAGKKIWGKEREQPIFSEANNCKDPLY